MKTKVVMFKFGDGPAEVKEGMKVFVVPYDSRRGGGSGREETVIKIGRLLVTVGDPKHDWRHEQFYIENGRMKTEYSGACLYTSKTAYERTLEENKFILEVQSRCGSNYTAVLTYAQAVRIKEILDEEA